MYVPFYIDQLEANRKQLFESAVTKVEPDVPIQDVFALYRRTRTMLDMHKAFVPNQPVQFDLGEFFEPYVRQWLVNTDNKTAQWVQAVRVNFYDFPTEAYNLHRQSRRTNSRLRIIKGIAPQLLTCLTRYEARSTSFRILNGQTSTRVHAFLPAWPR
jgi:hypothetical protein